MHHLFLILVIWGATCGISHTALPDGILMNLKSDQPGLYDFLDKSFELSVDSNAAKPTKMTLIDPADPAKGMRYQKHLLGQRKGKPNECFSIILNFIEFGYDKSGKPAFPPKSVRNIPHIESATISEATLKKH